MKTFDFIGAMISHILKNPRSKALEPDCLSPFAYHYDTASKGKREGKGVRLLPSARIDGISVEGHSSILQVYRR